MSDSNGQPGDERANPAHRIESLIAEIQDQKERVDMHLSSPARWRGLAKRELEGKEAPDVRKKLAIAYDAMIERVVRDTPLDVELLLQMHMDVVGGGEFRTRGVRVGKNDPVYRPHSSKVPSLVERSLERATDGLEPPELAAARLHLELLLIHPFSDSNGRVARLASAYVLMSAGYCSTLLATVEQHFQFRPREYRRAFRILGPARAGDHAQWLVTALEATVKNSSKAAWFWNRRDGLLEAAEKAGISEGEQLHALIDYDLGRDTENASRLLKGRRGPASPLVEIVKGMKSYDRAALVAQIERLNLEHIDEGIEEDIYVTTMLETLRRI